MPQTLRSYFASGQFVRIQVGLENAMLFPYKVITSHPLWAGIGATDIRWTPEVKFRLIPVAISVRTRRARVLNLLILVLIESVHTF
jgi:hypothetical protein